jgi:hypothetical protein
MAPRNAYRRTCGFAIGVVAVAVGVACSNSTSPHVGTPCLKYSGGSATAATLAGNYTLVSFCQDTLPAFGPAQGVNGTLTLTSVSPDSFKATINIPMQNPVVLAGPYALSHDTITVTVQGFGTFTVTYAFASHASADTLSVSGFLPGSPPPPIAIVFAK